MAHGDKSTRQLTAGVTVVKSLQGSVDLHRLELIAELDARKIWRADGYRDMAGWVAASFGQTHFAARRWVGAAHALPALPGVTRALRTGVLSLDKVCELTRFATPESEASLIRWATGVSRAAIRKRADLATKDPLAEVKTDDRARSLEWWYEDERRLWLEGFFPAEQGATVVAALEHLAEELPSDPDAERAATVEARRADALVALASGALAEPGAARARVSLHVDLDSLAGRQGSSEVESGGVLHPALTSLMCCDAVVQKIYHGAEDHVVGIGRASRNVPEWLLRQLRRRDRGCTFPGCQHKRYVKAHHIWWWEWGGPTNLDNLTLLCEFHHKLIHLYGWRVELGSQAGVVHWFRPDNRPYEPNRAPPDRDALAEDHASAAC